MNSRIRIPFYIFFLNPVYVVARYARCAAIKFQLFREVEVLSFDAIIYSILKMEKVFLRIMS